MTQAKVFNLLMGGLPRPERVRDFDMSIPDQVRFEYCGVTYKVECADLFAEEVSGKMLHSTNGSTFLSQLLKKQRQLSDA